MEEQKEMVLVHTLADGGTTTTGGGVVGDPYILRPDGSTVEFLGIAGTSYVFATSADLRVVFRCASIPGTLTHTMIDQVTVNYGTNRAETIVIGLSAVTANGSAVKKTAAAATAGDATVWWHTGAAGESRIDVAYSAWRIAVIQDPGTNLSIHPVTSPLHNVLHLGLFVDAYPPTYNFSTAGTSSLMGLPTGIALIPANFIVVI